MRHPSEGVLRRLVDEPAGVTDDDRAHVAGCPDLPARAGLRPRRRAARRRRARDVRRRRHGRGLGPVLGTTRRRSAAGRRPRRAQPVAAGLRRPVIAALSAVVLLTGAGVAAANDWLPIFRTEHVDPIEVTSSDLVALPDLSAYGDIEITQAGRSPAGRRRRGRARADRPRRPRGVRASRGVTGDPPYQAAGVVERDVHLLGREGRAGGGRRRRGPAAAARRARRQPAPAPGGSRRRGGLVAAHGRADARRRPRRRPHGGLLRRPVRDGEQLPAVPPRACPPRSPTSCATSPRTAAPCRCPCPRSW